MFKINRNKYKIFFGLVISFLFFSHSANAFCPVCTVAVAGGVGLSRYLGVDDLITGLWIGALIVAMIVWTLEWFKKKKMRFWGARTLTSAAYYAMIALPLYWNDIIGHPLNKFWGVDKLILGIVLGSIFFFLGGMIHFRLKAKNGDKVFFPFQKVAFAIVPLIILSCVFYFIIR